MLPQYIQQPAKVKQLAVTWDWNWVNWTNFDKFAFPDLILFADLTRLQIRADRSENRFESQPAELIHHNLNRCPEMLQHVTLDSMNLRDRDGQRSTILQVLGSAAASLTCLEMSQCAFKFGRSSISCLAHLKSLSLQGSEIWGDPSDITTLTNSTVLDLSESIWNWPNSETAPVMLLFTGWSALQVLKLSECSLFDRQSTLNCLVC